MPATFTVTFIVALPVCAEVNVAILPEFGTPSDQQPALSQLLVVSQSQLSSVPASLANCHDRSSV